MTDCPDARTLTRFAHGELDGPLFESVDAHLEQCRVCGDVLTRLRIHDDIIRDLRDLGSAHERIASALELLPDAEQRIAAAIAVAA